MSVLLYDYSKIAANPKLKDFLYRVPWVLDGVCQDPEGLIRSLNRECAQFKEWEALPHFTCLSFIEHKELTDLIYSFLCQSYFNWKLILVDQWGKVKKEFIEDERIEFISQENYKSSKNLHEKLLLGIKTDFIFMLESDSIIHPQALSLVAKFYKRNPLSTLITTNSAIIDNSAKRIVNFIRKPSYDYFTLLRSNYMGNASFVKQDSIKELFEKQSDFLFKEGFESLEYKTLLGVCKLKDFNPLHVPLFTTYIREANASTRLTKKSSSDFLDLKKQLLNEIYGKDLYNLSEQKQPLEWLPESLSIHPRLSVMNPCEILVVIPFFNNSNLTIACLQSLLNQSVLSSLRVILVNNNSSPSEVKVIQNWMRKHTLINTHLIDHNGPFNFAKINNKAVFENLGNATHILFLNNDVEVITSNALETMAAHLIAHKETAFVGIRLEYPDGQGVQHGGVKVVSGFAGSEYPNIGHATSRLEYVYEERTSMGVTFACAMTKVQVFKELGGLEECVIPNGFGDVDICLRAREMGYVNHFYGTLWGVHHESKTRSRLGEDLEFAFFHFVHGGTIARLRLQELSIIGSSPFPAKNNIGTLPLPLRYMLVDWLNIKIRKIPFVHNWLKWLIHKCGKYLK